MLSEREKGINSLWLSLFTDILSVIPLSELIQIWNLFPNPEEKENKNSKKQKQLKKRNPLSYQVVFSSFKLGNQTNQKKEVFVVTLKSRKKTIITDGNKLKKKAECIKNLCVFGLVLKSIIHHDLKKDWQFDFSRPLPPSSTLLWDQRDQTGSPPNAWIGGSLEGPW